ncbi:unnamed protein product [Bursaphelenchus xylophilus]|uniref:(pine wood nematode) hypothetical protein n=1 Tax=Bursaphelenchus xylophilus TaxID=6326 RepID=A0A1I7S1L1_BURXY|nr:unnamed protein product [Bursaphelenchus xylophilus]CAG9081315.1 unnamed protein product [Bursaphelenchus xylophilus]
MNGAARAEQVEAKVEQPLAKLDQPVRGVLHERAFNKRVLMAYRRKDPNPQRKIHIDYCVKRHDPRVIRALVCPLNSHRQYDDKTAKC